MWLLLFVLGLGIFFGGASPTGWSILKSITRLTCINSSWLIAASTSCAGERSVTVFRTADEYQTNNPLVCGQGEFLCSGTNVQNRL